MASPVGRHCPVASGSVTHSSVARGEDQGPGCSSSREASRPRQPRGSPSQRDGLSQTLLVILASFCLFLDLGLFFCETDTTVPALLLQSLETYLLLVLDLAWAYLGQVCPLSGPQSPHLYAEGVGLQGPPRCLLLLPPNLVPPPCPGCRCWVFICMISSSRLRATGPGATRALGYSGCICGT